MMQAGRKPSLSRIRFLPGKRIQLKSSSIFADTDFVTELMSQIFRLNLAVGTPKETGSKDFKRIYKMGMEISQQLRLSSQIKFIRVMDRQSSLISSNMVTKLQIPFQALLRVHQPVQLDLDQLVRQALYLRNQVTVSLYFGQLEFL